MHLIDVPDPTILGLSGEGVTVQLRQEIGDDGGRVLAGVLLLGLHQLSGDPQFFVNFSKGLSGQFLTRMSFFEGGGSVSETHGHLGLEGLRGDIRDGPERVLPSATAYDRI